MDHRELPLFKSSAHAEIVLTANNAFNPSGGGDVEIWPKNKKQLERSAYAHLHKKFGCFPFHYHNQISDIHFGQNLARCFKIQNVSRSHEFS
jgi:hypothetical protein